MKILHIHPNAAMSTRFIFPLMIREKLLGYETKLIVFNNNINDKALVEINLNINNLGLPKGIINFIIFLKKQKPDIVFCHNSIQATIPLLILKILKFKTLIYFNHGLTYLGYKGVLKGIFYTVEHLNAFLSDKTLTVSTDMKNYLNKIKPKTYMIHNGSACGLNLKINANIDSKKNNKKVVITYIGRLQVRKGLNVLKQILDFFENSNDVKFVFCGFSNKEFENYTKKKYKIVDCLGFIDTIENVLASSNIFVLPSLHEGLSYSILEALKFNNLVIANDIPGINSIITNDYNGILIKDNRPSSYINEINKFIQNRNYAKKHILNGKKTIKNFDRINFMKEYENFLLDISKNS